MSELHPSYGAVRLHTRLGKEIAHPLVTFRIYRFVFLTNQASYLHRLYIGRLIHSCVSGFLAVLRCYSVPLGGFPQPTGSLPLAA